MRRAYSLISAASLLVALAACAPEIYRIPSQDPGIGAVDPVANGGSGDGTPVSVGGRDRGYSGPEGAVAGPEASATAGAYPAAASAADRWATAEDRWRPGSGVAYANPYPGPGVIDRLIRSPFGLLPTLTPPPTVTPLPPSTLTPRPLPTDPPTPTPDPFMVAGPPVRLEMPAVGVDTIIEQVGLTADNAMDVPRGWMNVGWFLHGFRPGEPGSAVIAGHLDTNTGGPAVFWDLNQLRPGDEIVVTYENGDRYTFVVQASELFDKDADGPIIERIFGPSQTPDLNLITCDGAWDRGQATYTKRLVVFTTLAPEKTVRASTAGAYE